MTTDIPMPPDPARPFALQTVRVIIAAACPTERGWYTLVDEAGGVLVMHVTRYDDTDRCGGPRRNTNLPLWANGPIST